MTEADLITERDLVPAEVRDDLADIAAAVKKHGGATVESVIEVGELLAEARKRLAKHKTGIFYKWIVTECNITPQTARNCMNAAAEWGNCKTILQFDPTALYVLSAPSCPSPAKEAAERHAEAGGMVTAKLAKELVAKHKPEKEDEPLTDMELIDLIRKSIWVVWQRCPEHLRPIVAPKFVSFAQELGKTGDLSW